MNVLGGHDQQGPGTTLRQLPPGWIAVLVGGAAALQGAAFFLCEPVGNALGRSKTLLDYCAATTVADLGILVLLGWVVHRQGEPLSLETFGLRPLRWSTNDSRGRAVVGLVCVVVLVALTISPMATWTIDRLWAIAPGPSWVLGNPAAYKGTFPINITATLVAFQLLVRIPLTAVTEEVLFRGYLQPRLGRWAPVTSGVLFAFYHVGSQWWTVIELIPFGIALGVLRWWTRSVVPGTIVHYASDALFLLTAI